MKLSIFHDHGGCDCATCLFKPHSIIELVTVTRVIKGSLSHRLTIFNVNEHYASETLLIKKNTVNIQQLKDDGVVG